MLDFFQIQIGPDGLANIAFANNGSSPPDASVEDKEDNTSVWYARQTAGPSAGNAQHDSASYCPTAAGGPGLYIRGTTKAPAKRPAAMPATGVSGHLMLAWILLAAAAAVAGRLRMGRATGAWARIRR